MGKGGGSSSPSTQTSTTVNVPWGPTQPYLKEYQDLLNQLLTGSYTASGPGVNGAAGGTPTLTPNPLPQQQLAGFTPGELQGLNLEYGAVPGEQGVTGTAAGQAANILSGNNLNPTTNPYLTSYYNAAAAPLVNQYETATAPTAESNAELSGAFGGSAQAENTALNQYNLGNNLQSLAANIYEPAYQQAQQQITQTLGLAPSIASGLNIPGETALGAGGLQQQQNQAGLNTAYGNAYQQAMWPYQQLSYLGSGLTGLGSEGGGTLSNYPNPNAGGGSNKKAQDIGSAASIGSIAALAFA